MPWLIAVLAILAGVALGTLLVIGTAMGLGACVARFVPLSLFQASLLSLLSLVTFIVMIVRVVSIFTSSMRLAAEMGLPEEDEVPDVSAEGSSLHQGIGWQWESARGSQAANGSRGAEAREASGMALRAARLSVFVEL
jgi:hypothetical protein